jgi:protein-S-isoprenylcysteine O-methyltransferase Ste14
MIFRFIFLILWLIPVVFWIVMAGGNKTTVVAADSGWRWRFYGSFVVLVIIFFSFPGCFRRRLVPFSEAREWLGIAVCALGVAIAIWARSILGRNWSGNPTIKEDHELVERGPYRWVRHPIYTGILLALIGTGIARAQVRDVVLFVFSFVALWLKLRVEERLMLRQFPEAYPEYMRRTKALVPFLL